MVFSLASHIPHLSYITSLKYYCIFPTVSLTILTIGANTNYEGAANYSTFQYFASEGSFLDYMGRADYSINTNMVRTTYILTVLEC
jgi:hypothetical protein